MKYIVLLCGFMLTHNLKGQNDQGTIIYDRTVYYTRIIESLPYLSQEEKDIQKLTWGKQDGYSSKYNLTFDPNQSVYTYGVNDKEYTWSWRKDEYLVINDLSKKRELKNQFVLGGKLYLIKDQNPRIKWKIENEIREIAGYLCMKATTIDTIKGQTISAWFTDQIPVSSGPEGFGGLPGMILMLDKNDGTAIVEATSVNMEVPSHPIPKKIKGKELSYTEYEDLIKKFFKQSIEGERNPFWEIAY